MSDLTLRGLTISYGRKGMPAAVRELDLEVRSGQLVSLLGPSGCGKTTTMRAVAGLLQPQAGRIVLAGDDITATPAHRRDIGLVFQSYALFPHLSTFENVAFGLRLRKVGEAQLRQRVDAALASVNLAEFAARLPAQLSGGQQQRVALARAMVIRPRLLLLDEPLSNLDAALRLEMRAEVRRLQRALGTTMLYVTHDQDEALALSDRIVVMRAGRIEQDAAPAELYERPATPFVAGFMGCENLFEWRDGVLRGGWGGAGGAEGGGGGGGVGGGDSGGTGRAPGILPMALAPEAGRGLTHLAWRPGQVPVLAPGSATAPGALPGRVLARSYLGEAVQYLVDTALGPVKGSAGPDAAWQEGDAVAVLLDPARAAHLRSE